MAQWNKNQQDYLNQERTLFEVFNVATIDGQQVTFDNPFPVSIGSSSITINGEVVIPGTIEISNDEGNPIPTHTHLFDENDDEYTASNPFTIDGTVNIGNEVSINDGGNSITVDGTVSVSAGASIAITGQNLDAFGRLRVSEPFTLADYSHVYGEEAELLTKTVGAASTTTASGTEAAIILSVGTGATDQVIHQSRMYHHYMPGKSQYILESFNFREPRNNTYKAIGYFDDYNGVFAKQVGIGTTARYDIVKRSNVGGAVTETAIPQSEWNVDSLDGTGPSGINIFFERSQLLFIDYQWLGVGRIRVGFENGGTFHTAHEFTHTGDIEYVYWSLPSLPVRCEVGNFGAAVGIASMAQMCATVMSEGGYMETGVEFSADNGGTLIQGSNNSPDDYKCVMAIRLKNSYKGLQNRSIVRVTDLELLSTSASCKFELWRIDDASSITGGTWISANDDSVVEYNTTPTSISFTGADKRASGFFAANNPSGKQASGTISIDPTTAKRSYLSQNIDSDNSNAYVVMVRNLTTNANTNVYVAIQWRETR